MHASVRIPVSWLVATVAVVVAVISLAAGTASASHQLRLQTVVKSVKGFVNPSSSFADAQCPARYRVVGGGGGGQTTGPAEVVMVSSSLIATSWGVEVQNRSSAGSVQAYAKVICARLR
jgi:hypothetical protein